LDIELDEKVCFNLSFFAIVVVTVNLLVQMIRIKEKVEEQSGVPPAQQRLIYGGRQMYSLIFCYLSCFDIPGQAR